MQRTLDAVHMAGIVTCEDLLAEQVAELVEELVRATVTGDAVLVGLLRDDHQIVHGVTVVLIPA